MKKLSVLIPDGEGMLTLKVIRSLGFVDGVEVDILTTDRWHAAGFSRFCRRCHVTPSGLNETSRRQVLLDTVAKSPVDVILPCSAEGIRLVLAEKQSLMRHAAIPLLPELDQLERANDKTLLCRFARDHDIPVPSFLVFPDDVPDLACLEKLTYPVLLKPAAMGGGRGIRLFHDPKSLGTFLATDSFAKTGGRCLLQRYVPGVDFGLNLLCRDGEILAYTVQRCQIGHPSPFGPSAGIHFVKETAPLEIGRKLMSALRWNGIANLDMRQCAASGQMMLLEVNPRYWGSVLGSVFAGINFPYLACLGALGEPIPPSDYKTISFLDESRILINELILDLAGRSRMPELQLRHTSLFVSMKDPLPAFAGRFGRILEKLTQN